MLLTVNMVSRPPFWSRCRPQPIHSLAISSGSSGSLVVVGDTQQQQFRGVILFQVAHALLFARSRSWVKTPCSWFIEAGRLNIRHYWAGLIMRLSHAGHIQHECGVDETRLGWRGAIKPGRAYEGECGVDETRLGRRRAIEPGRAYEGRARAVIECYRR